MHLITDYNAVCTQRENVLLSLAQVSHLLSHRFSYRRYFTFSMLSTQVVFSRPHEELCKSTSSDVFYNIIEPAVNS